VAVADVYDALTSERSYKKAMPHDEAVAFIRSQSGTHFDPDVVAAFTLCQADFRSVLNGGNNGDPSYAEVS
jgi:putative two-component system response regulator